MARQFAEKAEIVEWGGESSIDKVIEVLERRGARAGRVAVVGPMHFEQHAKLATKFGPISNINRAYGRLRAVKSEEELDWLRIGAAFSDAGMFALRDSIEIGQNERELSDLIERAYVGEGGGTGITIWASHRCTTRSMRCRGSSRPLGVYNVAML